MTGTSTDVATGVQINELYVYKVEVISSIVMSMHIASFQTLPPTAENER